MSRARGTVAETAALDHLQSQGLTLIERNYSCRLGEIDLIMQDGETLIFLEVRQRHHKDYASGAESVDYYKQRKIINTARHYLQRHPAAQELDCRFDVVSMASRIDWIRNAFTLDG